MPPADFKPTASIEMLQRRSELTLAIHQFFSARDFIHVETPLLSRDTVVDRYIHPVGLQKSTLTGRDADQETLWLQTSPEFCMKRLLASGATAIYQIAKAFRQGESGGRHNPEFTMLEWYRVGDDMRAGMELLSVFASTTLNRPKSKVLSYGDAFRKMADVDPFVDTVESFGEALQAGGVSISEFAGETDRDFWLNLILTHLVEPKLGFEAPVIIYDWPPSQAALAIVRDGSPPVAERFELYVDGVELGNGYHELLDADELVRRNKQNNTLREDDGSDPLPVDSRLLDAMRSGMPSCSGVAVGVDRLLMVLEGCQNIEQVIAFPLDRA